MGYALGYCTEYGDDGYGFDGSYGGLGWLLPSQGKGSTGGNS